MGARDSMNAQQSLVLHLSLRWPLESFPKLCNITPSPSAQCFFQTKHLFESRYGTFSYSLQYLICNAPLQSPKKLTGLVNMLLIIHNCMIVHPKILIQPSCTRSHVISNMVTHSFNNIGLLLMTTHESGGDPDDYCTVDSNLSNGETCNHNRLMMLLGNEQ